MWELKLVSTSFVMSLERGLYVLVSLNKSSIFVVYSTRSITTVVLPLSALVTTMSLAWVVRNVFESFRFL